MLLGVAVTPAFAAVDVRLYPSSGYAVLTKDFAVDIMLNTDGNNTTTARAVIRFDPNKLQVTKAEHGDLYCQYPEDEYAVDNENGWIKITGFCLDPYYNSESSSGIFARFTFRPSVEGAVNLNFEFDGTDGEWKSYVKDTGSPPENILESRPQGGTYSVVSSIPSSTTDDSEKLPGVGLFENKFFFLGLGLCFLGVSILIVDFIVGKIKESKIKSSSRVVTV